VILARSIAATKSARVGCGSCEQAQTESSRLLATKQAMRIIGVVLVVRGRKDTTLGVREAI
jgi:hypothetical protein